MRIKAVLIVAAVLVLVVTGGCGTTNDSNLTEGAALSVETKDYNDLGESVDNINTYENLKAGDEVYRSAYGVIKVKSVNAERIVLKIDGYFVEPNEDGSINLSAHSLKKITIQRGESIKLNSQTMDAGVKLTIKYE